MSDIAIKVEHLAKRFQLGSGSASYSTLRDKLAGAFYGNYKRCRRLAGRFLRKITGRQSLSMASGHSASNIIWALKDVSFEVKRGEIVGVIGQNGAGKSTLLKILSRITEPTKGYAEIHGRLGSLLEVGTGFHQELTGRENIYLNAAILGMKKREIERKFDEIVSFAEISKFVDTPVKHYSSGMYVRLAFAVAAHLDPEILIIDEVLSVGDVQFQKKCIGKMDEVAKQGRTVLFVSHNMSAIIQLCPHSILLSHGRIVSQGPSREVVDSYLASLFSSENKLESQDSSQRSGDGRLRFKAVYLQNDSNKRINTPIAGHPMDIVLEFNSNEKLSHVQFALTIYNQMEIAVTHCNVDAYGKRLSVAKGEGKVICHIPKLPLPRGRYKISISAYNDMGWLDVVPHGCIFDVETSNFFSTTYMPAIQHSAFLIEHSWKLIN